jgi:DUF1707 SHOCT-like domain
MIPGVPLPLPVFPGPDWGAVFGADVRASNADRDLAADILCAAVADGRLTLDELDDRLEDVLSARTLREVAALISDLPARPSGRLAPPAETRPRPPALTRWSLLQSLLTVPRGGGGGGGEGGGGGG